MKPTLIKYKHNPAAASKHFVPAKQTIFSKGAGAMFKLGQKASFLKKVKL